MSDRENRYGIYMADNNVTYWIRESTWPDETHSWLGGFIHIEKKKSYNYNIYIYSSTTVENVENMLKRKRPLLFFQCIHTRHPSNSLTVHDRWKKNFDRSKEERDIGIWPTKCPPPPPHWFKIKKGSHAAFFPRHVSMGQEGKRSGPVRNDREEKTIGNRGPSISTRHPVPKVPLSSSSSPIIVIIARINRSFHLYISLVYTSFIFWSFFFSFFFFFSPHTFFCIPVNGYRFREFGQIHKKKRICVMIVACRETPFFPSCCAAAYA